MREVFQDVVGLCKNIMTLLWNNCVSFYVVATVIQSMSISREPHFLNSLPYFFSFLYAVIFHSQKLSPFWYNCSWILKFSLCGAGHYMCIYIENGLFSLLFWNVIYNSEQLVEKVCDIQHCVKICTVIQFSHCDISINVSVLTGIEVLTVVRIQNMVWVMTPYSLVRTWLWIFWNSILGLSTMAIRWWKS
jgi:hypothetical protein